MNWAPKETFRVSLPKESSVVRSIWVDPSPHRDIAVLVLVDTLKAPGLPILNRLPEIGSSLYVLGFPFDEDLVLTSGIVNQFPKRNILGHTGIVGMSASVYPGNSGGPVVDAQGRVVGIVLGFYKGANTLNYMTPSTHIWESFDKWKGIDLKPMVISNQKS